MENQKAICLPFADSTLKRKLVAMLWRFRQTRATFILLKSEVNKALAEATDVFQSISVPLMRLVDLKSQQIKKQGRKSLVIFKKNTSENGQNLKNKAATHVRNIILKEQEQAKQLFAILKAFETKARAIQSAVTLRFDESREFVSRMQDRFLAETRRLHRKVQNLKESEVDCEQNSSLNEQSYKALLSLILELQHAVFEGFREGLSQITDDMEELLNELANHMCQPLVAYLKQLNLQGIATIVRQLMSLLNQIEEEFIQQIPVLMAEIDALSQQIQITKLQVKERDQDLEETRSKLLALHARLDVKEKDHASLRLALTRQQNQHEELRKICKMQSNTIEMLEQERRNRDSTSIGETNSRLKVDLSSSSTLSAAVGKVAELISSWITEATGRGNTYQHISKQKCSAGFLRQLQLRLNEHHRDESSEKKSYPLSPSPKRRKNEPESRDLCKPKLEEKLGDEFLSRVLGGKAKGSYISDGSMLDRAKGAKDIVTDTSRLARKRTNEADILISEYTMNGGNAISLLDQNHIQTRSSAGRIQEPGKKFGTPTITSKFGSNSKSPGASADSPVAVAAKVCISRRSPAASGNFGLKFRSPNLTPQINKFSSPAVASSTKSKFISRNASPQIGKFSYPAAASSSKSKVSPSSPVPWNLRSLSKQSPSNNIFFRAGQGRDILSP